MSSPQDPNNTIIVLGAGLAGLSLALGLARQGYHVDLVERNSDFSRTGATFGLARNGQKALDELYPGISDEMAEFGLPLPNGGTMLGWWNMRDALLTRVHQETERIHLRTGWTLQDIDDGDDFVTARFQKKNSEQEVTLQGFLFVGADGVNSVVRAFLELPRAREVNITLWRGRMTIPPQEGESEAADLLRPYLDIPVMPMGYRLRGPVNYTLFNFHPKLQGTMALVVNVQEDNVNEIPQGATPHKYMEPVAKDEKELREMQAMLELIEKDGLTHPVRLKVVELPKEDGAGWGGKGRVTIIGDAAHGMRPASGQGGSMAFEDSVVFCRVLKTLKEESSSEWPSSALVEQAIMEFENTRLPRVRKIWDEQWERSEMAYKNIVMEPWSKTFEEWVFNGV